MYLNGGVDETRLISAGLRLMVWSCSMCSVLGEITSSTAYTIFNSLISYTKFIIINSYTEAFEMFRIH